MTAPLSLLLALIGLVVSARVRLGVVIFGRPVSVPLLGLVLVVLVLVLTAIVLALARSLIREGLCLRPKVART
jgi:hypothetical protein